MMLATTLVNAQDVIFEIRPHRHYVKVSAVHVITGTEIAVLCPANVSRDVLEHVALSKLEYVLRKYKNNGTAR